MVLSRSHNSGWCTIAQLGSLSLPVTALAPARPPHLLLSGAGNQLQHVSCLATPVTATAGMFHTHRAGLTVPLHLVCGKLLDTFYCFSIIASVSVVASNINHFPSATSCQLPSFYAGNSITSLCRGREAKRC